jgi:hypothetical protein
MRALRRRFSSVQELDLHVAFDRGEVRRRDLVAR